jgi:hypothetical protein
MDTTSVGRTCGNSPAVEALQLAATDCGKQPPFGCGMHEAVATSLMTTSVRALPVKVLLVRSFFAEKVARPFAVRSAIRIFS